MTSKDITALIEHIEAVKADYEGTPYAESFSQIILSLKFNAPKEAQRLAENMLSGAEEDRASDMQITTIINAIDGTLERLGLPL